MKEGSECGHGLASLVEEGSGVVAWCLDELGGAELGSELT
jgi:hypothetical protein